ncbi:tRNA lysidine(34) synthetase TilS [Psychrobacter sp. GP33]|uniref:tRNA lysidine(34) synthetase TilS n=1 Tax=Psychrobacter sp. GP33 TaxID=2758709 RepID=UPI0015F7BD17|nr:tRNA lysidine(34) synthetase TilS [Psychrobacter sp. GP33]
MSSRAIRSYPIEPINASVPIDKNLAAALLASLAECGEQLQGRRIWLACSGGRDSLALAALCLQLYRNGKLPFLPQLLHVNHGLQVDSDNWAQHVANWAQVQQMPCYILPVTVAGQDEQAARQARYQAMYRHINQGDVLVLAHHADDQAETVLMRLIQGAGVNGLSGMQAWREHRQGARHNSLWRPWLSVSRADITSYAERLQLPYINDPTNDSGDNVRSGLRRDIMPILARYNANVVHNIARSAQLLADAHASVSAQAHEDCQHTAITSLCYPPFQRVLDIDKLSTLPPYRQRQLLHYWLAQDEPLPPAKQLVDDMLALIARIDANHQTALDWYANTNTYRIHRYRQQLFRLSHSFLDWLAMPLVEQTQLLTSVYSSNDCSDDKPNNIILRADKSYSWQLQLIPDIYEHLLKLISNQLHPHFNNTDTLLIKITLLGRQQRLQTALATRPQAGKKLMQTLSIPVWLRDSLVVVSVVLPDTDVELPLLLLSPFTSWVLGIDKSSIDKSSIDSTSDDFGNVLDSSISSHLHCTLSSK